MRYGLRHNNSYKRIGWYIIFIILIFFDTLTLRMPLGSYLDEFIAMTAFIWIFIDRKTIRKHSEETRMVVCVFLIIIIGLLCNFIFNYVTDIGIIFRDLVGTFKFFFTFCGFYYIFGKNKTDVSKGIFTITKILICLIFTFGILSLLFDFGMGGAIRYGLRSYKFIFDYYNTLIMVEVILIATLMCESKHNIIYYVMALGSVALTIRTKGIAVVILTVAFKYFETKKHNPITYGKISKSIKYVIPIAALIVFATRNKLAEYLSWGKYNSIRIGALAEGWDIFKDHFPCGTGFGTYGTNLSYNTGSVLYQTYGRIKYSLMMDANYGFATMSDTYWPSIYVQFGLFGFLLFIYCLAQCFIMIRKSSGISESNKQAALFIFIYLLIASISEASFSNSSGVVSAMMMTLLLNMSGKQAQDLRLEEGE